MIKCACLVTLNTKKDKLLLVRVRNNEKWFLPGGKIDNHETPEEALMREIKEELNVNLYTASIKYQVTIFGDAYGLQEKVKLICFSADWDSIIIPSSEVSEARYIDWKKERYLLAPAVCNLCDEWLK